MAQKTNNMDRKAKGPGFKMKGHTLPGIKQVKSATIGGRAKSSAFQADEEIIKKRVATVDVLGGDKTEGGRAKFNRMRAETEAMGVGSKDDKLANLEKEYGVEFTKVKREDGSGSDFRTADGLTVKQLAVKQGLEKSAKRDAYIEANKTK